MNIFVKDFRKFFYLFLVGDKYIDFPDYVL